MIHDFIKWQGGGQMAFQPLHNLTIYSSPHEWQADQLYAVKYSGLTFHPTTNRGKNQWRESISQIAICGPIHAS